MNKSTRRPITLVRRCRTVRVYDVLFRAAEFGIFLRYARNLQFTDVPNYSYLSGLFLGLMKRSGWSCDWEFDWLGIDLASIAVHMSVLSKYHNRLIVLFFTGEYRLYYSQIGLLVLLQNPHTYS